MKNINSIFDKVIYGLLMLLPIFILVFAFIHVSFHTENGSVNGMYEKVEILYSESIDGLLDTTGSEVYNAISLPISYIWSNGEEQAPQIITGIATWWVYVTLIHVLIDILRWIPSVLIGILKKAGVDDEI